MDRRRGSFSLPLLTILRYDEGSVQIKQSRLQFEFLVGIGAGHDFRQQEHHHEVSSQCVLLDIEEGYVDFESLSLIGAQAARRLVDANDSPECMPSCINGWSRDEPNGKVSSPSPGPPNKNASLESLSLEQAFRLSASSSPEGEGPCSSDDLPKRE